MKNNSLTDLKKPEETFQDVLTLTLPHFLGHH